MRLIVVLSIAGACFGQGKQNVVQTGIVDAHGANWIPPAATFASPPSSAATGSVYIFTDAIAVGTCSGGASALAVCRWSGSAWQALGGGGGGTAGGSTGQMQVNSSGSFAGQAFGFDGGGSRVSQRGTECANGTVSLSVARFPLYAFWQRSAMVDRCFQYQQGHGVRPWSKV